MSGRSVLLLALLHAALAAAILLAGMAAGRADPVAWRIELLACRAEACRKLPPSARRWSGRFACQARAADLARFADLAVRLPAGTALRARCASVDGLPDA